MAADMASSPVVQVVRPPLFNPPHLGHFPAYPPQVVTYPPTSYASPPPNQVVLVPVNNAMNPLALCQQKGHEPMTNYGTLGVFFCRLLAPEVAAYFSFAGIISAIFCFPVGIICCLLDQRTMCRRCGAVLSAGCD
ncbi:hypothetical protein M378DRAFT_385114 [Amanita muscaria Koide BX008]|uniref:Uncharacterized protein n=1 Tax=Amanita muscaria (strain Koide BX008) TaxID=946122 RepID=A0A0C2SSN2_AMAMK|nr:hypothetical protein M378DRAFT_385114 [Amanita muscaria Koide BX008]